MDLDRRPIPPSRSAAGSVDGASESEDEAARLRPAAARPQIAGGGAGGGAAGDEAGDSSSSELDEPPSPLNPRLLPTGQQVGEAAQRLGGGMRSSLSRNFGSLSDASLQSGEVSGGEDDPRSVGLENGIFGDYDMKKSPSTKDFLLQYLDDQMAKRPGRLSGSLPESVAARRMTPAKLAAVNRDLAANWRSDGVSKGAAASDDEDAAAAAAELGGRAVGATGLLSQSLHAVMREHQREAEVELGTVSEHQQKQPQPSPPSPPPPPHRQQQQQQQQRQHAVASPRPAAATPPKALLELSYEAEGAAEAVSAAAGEGGVAPSGDGAMAKDVLKAAAHVYMEGVESIVDDNFWKCFQSHKPRPWNWNAYLWPLWLSGVVIRYLFLFPIRLAVFALGWLVFGVGMALVQGCMARGEARTRREHTLISMMCGVFCITWGAVIRYHGAPVTPRAGQPQPVYVANHTSMIDVIILQQMRCFSLVGQKHKGIVRFLQEVVLGCLQCVWFDRGEIADRTAVARKLSEHAHDPTRNPLLVFPEGTCVNNEYVIQFKKGIFELGVPVVPIAIKYTKTFVDPFWNSRAQSFPMHLVELMTSWCLICDVWYLKPSTIRAGETPEDFAQRIKESIALKAGLHSVNWDGYMKYWKPSERYLRARQLTFAKSLRAIHKQRVEQEERQAAEQARRAQEQAKRTHEQLASQVDVIFGDGGASREGGLRHRHSPAAS